MKGKSGNIMLYWIRSYSEEMAEAIQRMLFKKGYKWWSTSGGNAEVQHTNATAFFVGTGLMDITYGSNNDATSEHTEMSMEFLANELPALDEYDPEEAEKEALELGLVTKEVLATLLNNGMSHVDASIKKWEALKEIFKLDITGTDAIQYVTENKCILLSTMTCGLCAKYLGFGLVCDESNGCPLHSSGACSSDGAFGRVDRALTKHPNAEVSDVEACNEMLEALRAVKEEEDKAEITYRIGQWFECNWTDYSTTPFYVLTTLFNGECALVNETGQAYGPPCKMEIRDNEISEEDFQRMIGNGKFKPVDVEAVTKKKEKGGKS